MFKQLFPFIEVDTKQFSLETALYESFYRKYGMRFVAKLTSPSVSPLSEWDMPRYSILHYLPSSEQDYCISPNYPLLQGWDKQLHVYHILDTAKQLGAPRPKVFQSRIAINALRKLYPTLKWIRDERMLAKLYENQQALIIFNYGMMDKKLRYRPIPMLEIFKWENNRSTVWTNIERQCELSKRQQFIEWEPPANILTKQILDRSNDELKRVHLGEFPTSAHLDLLDFWRWLNPSKRHLSQMGLVKEKHLNQVNIVFNTGGNFLILNLAKLNEWVKGESLDELEDDEEFDGDNGYIAIQKRFLKFLNGLNALGKPQNVDTTISDVNKQVEYHLENNIEVVIDDEEDVPNDHSPIVKDQEETSVVNVSTVDLSETPVVKKDETTGVVTVTYVDRKTRREVALRKSKLMQQIESNYSDTSLVLKAAKDDDIVVKKELTPEAKQALEEEENLKLHANSVIAEFTSSIVKDAKAQEKLSQLSAAEVRRIEAMSLQFTKMRDPYGEKKTLLEALTEEIPMTKEKPVKEIKDIPLVMDKTMLQSTIREYDKRYIKHVLKRDVMRSLMSVQKANVVVTNYEVKAVKDAANDFEVHTMQVAPVGGSPSTYHIKLPKINEDGTILSNGTRFVMRKKRMDENKMLSF